ncbi:MAG: putative Ig domain-containing protein, partial [Burkholderiales bacterium]|nr:putative Ig domain-containing protein [Burkholderiales bacterium]
VIASDGKATASQHFNVTVEQGYAKPTLAAVAPQTLREGERYALQLAANMAGGLTQADGTAISLEYSAPWLPGGATLNAETGWFEWTPDYAQHGIYTVPFSVTATFTPPDGDPVTTTGTRNVGLNVLNANGAPIFDAAETWNVLEGQPLRVSVFAFDPDNPGFEPKIRLTPTGAATGPETTAATVTYQVIGLPAGASFDQETLEIVWPPGYAQAGTYSITVTATDDGDGTGTPAVSQVILPIVVSNANRAPEIGDIANAFVDKGNIIEIPVSAVDADGNPVQLTFSGLPRFAAYTQNPSSANGSASGVIRFAPGAGDRGDYAITVVATDDGDGNVNQVLTQARMFVLTVKSPSEAPVITAPRQVVAVVGQALSVAISIGDIDQDPLSYSATGLPIGAVLAQLAQYGQALLTWTPAAGDIGPHDIEITVTDSGLPPQDAGYVNPDNPVANVTTQKLRIVVRNANVAPEVLGVQVNATQVTDTGNAATALQLNATEGVPLTIEVFGRDTDADLINWSTANLPRGMTFEVPSSGNGNRALLHWTPDLYAAQDDNTTSGTPGLWRFTVEAGDGMAEFSRTFEITVANVNQTPRFLPMPLQLVSEGDTLSFNMRTADADNDPVRTSLIYDENTPAGVSFDGTSGYIEWTPGQDAVDNAAADSKPYTFTFSATDGVATTTKTVQVRVFDVNRVPRLTAGNHAVVIGQTLSIPVQLGGSINSNGIIAIDDDGSAQTQALAISFTGLPEGAYYDAQARRLIWTPGPGQIGDVVISARAGDGRNTTVRTFTIRTVADAAANEPKILVSTTPGTPALPGQTIVASVRADAYSGIDSIAVEVRGAAFDGHANGAQWQTVALDGAGRLRLIPAQPGLIEVRVTATDRDGFSSTQTHTIRVKDPADTQAPALAWTGVLSGATALGRPLDITQITALQAVLQERQLMGYKLEIAPANTGAWLTLSEQSAAAADSNRQLNVAALDPARFANGVYQVRFSAWDLAGRTSTIDARVIIDTEQKNLATETATDASYTLDGHSFALSRSLDAAPGAEFGNWRIPALDMRLTTDQPGTTSSGAIAPWMDGARVWLQAPDSLSLPEAAQNALSFTLSTTSEPLGTEAGAPRVWHPVFSGNQGWTLDAHSDQDDAPEMLLRQGHNLYSQITGLPWVPSSYTLTGPDGTRYALDAGGKVTGVSFADGAEWLVSNAGIAAVTADASTRVDFIRDSQGRLSRVTGPGDTPDSDAKSIVYRYDDQGRLILARTLNTPDFGTPYGYDAAGKPFTDTITANLGAAVDWLASSASNQWIGTLQAGQTTTLAFAVRASELASAVKVPGAEGAVIIAIETQLADQQADLQVTGATVLGTTNIGGRQTTLLRVTEAGLKLIRLTGAGSASVRVSIAGDLNRNGVIDGIDSAAWVQAAAASASIGDLNGDGLVNQADRQVLYANYGWKANQAPVAASTLPEARTHTDLATHLSLNSIAQDLEGDLVLWRLLDATHGSARFSADGQSLLFTPEAGYAGSATIRVQADDGFAAGAPIALTVNVSGAKLLSIRLTNLDKLSSLQQGQAATLQASADFEDETGVAISNGSYLHVGSADISGMNYLGSNPVQVDDARDRIRASGVGAALITASRTDAQGHAVSAVAGINTSAAPAPITDSSASEGSDGAPDPFIVRPDVYPGTLALVPGGTRQLKVDRIDANTGETRDVHSANPDATSGTRYFSSDETIATVSAEGLITAHQAGKVTISVVHLGSQFQSVFDDQGNVIATVLTDQQLGQSDITLTVQVAQVTDNDHASAAPRSITIAKDTGGVVTDTTGETVMIGAGALASDAPVSIQRIAIDNLQTEVGLFVPAPSVLTITSRGVSGSSLM